MAIVNALKATSRPEAGKGAARAVRRQGRVPGVIYGDKQSPLTISLDYDELKQQIYAGHFLTSICNVDVDGKVYRTIPRDFQLDPVRDLPVHVDFMRLGAGASIRVRIPVHVQNADQSPGIKRGGTVNIVTHTIEVRCSADAIPEAINVDITGLEISHSRHLSDITLPPNVKPLIIGDATLVTIVPPSGYAEELKAAAEAAAAAATAAAAAPAAAPGGGAAAPGAPAAPAAEKAAEKGGEKK